MSKVNKTLIPATVETVWEGSSSGGEITYSTAHITANAFYRIYFTASPFDYSMSCVETIYIGSLTEDGGSASNWIYSTGSSKYAIFSAIACTDGKVRVRLTQINNTSIVKMSDAITLTKIERVTYGDRMNKTLLPPKVTKMWSGSSWDSVSCSTANVTAGHFYRIYVTASPFNYSMTTIGTVYIDSLSENTSVTPFWIYSTGSSKYAVFYINVGYDGNIRVRMTTVDNTTLSVLYGATITKVEKLEYGG